MKEKTKYVLGLVAIVSMFLFIGVTVFLNIHDGLMGTNYANFANLVGWCLVPIGILILISFYVYEKFIKKPLTLV